MIFNIMAKRKKSGVVPPTLHYCGHNAKKIGPKKSLLKIYTLHTLIRSTSGKCVPSNSQPIKGCLLSRPMRCVGSIVHIIQLVL